MLCETNMFYVNVINDTDNYLTIETKIRNKKTMKIYHYLMISVICDRKRIRKRQLIKM